MATTVPELGPVRHGVEAAIGDPDDAVQYPTGEIVLDYADDYLIGRVAGEVQHLTGIPLAVTAVPITT